MPERKNDGILSWKKVFPVAKAEDYSMLFKKKQQNEYYSD